MKKIYLYGKKLISMEALQVASIMEALERQARSGSITYGPREFSKEQAAAIRQSWPADSITWLKARVAQIVGENKPSYANFTVAVADACDEEARRMSGRDQHAAKRRLKMASADMAISLALGAIPHPGLQAPSKDVRGKKITWQSSEKTVNLVADANYDGDAHVLVHYNEQLGRSWLVGWASKADLMAGQPREPNQRQVAFASLRPISELLGVVGATSSVDGVLVEKTPKPDDVPSGSDLEIIQSDAAEKFDEIIFGTKKYPAVQNGGENSSVKPE